MKIMIEGDFCLPNPNLSDDFGVHVEFAKNRQNDFY